MITFATKVILAMLISYLIGSFSFAIFISKLVSKDDIRQYGSGNAGAANMTRTMGLSAGVLTLVGDLLKGSLAVLVGVYFSGSSVAQSPIEHSEAIMFACICGLMAFVGHWLPIYFNFKGGKGVATAAGVFLMIDGYIFLLFVLFWAGTILLTRYVGLGAVIGGWSYPFSVYLLWGSKPEEVFVCVFTLAIVVALAITYFHRGNLSRMTKGTEPKFDNKKHEKEEKYG